MANPHPEPHPENLKNFKKGETEKQRKGGHASQEAQRRKRTMREWAELMGSLPMKRGKTTDPKAAKGDVRAAEYIAKLKGQTTDDVTVHIDTMAQMDTDDLLRLYEATRKKGNE